MQKLQKLPIDIKNLIFLNVGGFFLVNKIGIRATDVMIEINMKGS